MRFTGSENRALVYSSDTAWTERVLKLMRGASLAIVEASVPVYHSDNERLGHLTPELAGRMAREAGVERLVVTHCADRNAEITLQRASEAFGKRVALAREGERHTV
jgi:ribonuclease BN (tRNA processing enzyme)